MSIRSSYSQPIVTFAISLENQALEATDREDYFNDHGTYAQWEDAFDEVERITYWYEAITRIFPGVVNCEHGMSLQMCYGPAHYASDYEISQGW